MDANGRDYAHLDPFREHALASDTPRAQNLWGERAWEGQSLSANAVSRRGEERGVAAHGRHGASCRSKEVTGLDGRGGGVGGEEEEDEEEEEDPFEIAPPHVDTTALHRAAQRDEMGLHSSRARFARGKVCAPSPTHRHSRRP